jgi:hypothetical protein
MIAPVPHSAAQVARCVAYSLSFLRRYVVKGGDNDIKAALTAAMASFATVSSPGASTADDAGSAARTGKHVRLAYTTVGAPQGASPQ